MHVVRRREGYEYEDDQDEIIEDLEQRLSALLEGDDPRTLTGLRLAALRQLQQEEIELSSIDLKCQIQHTDDIFRQVEFEVFGQKVSGGWRSQIRSRHSSHRPAFVLVHTFCMTQLSQPSTHPHGALRRRGRRGDSEDSWPASQRHHPPPEATTSRPQTWGGRHALAHRLES